MSSPSAHKAIMCMESVISATTRLKESGFCASIVPVLTSARHVRDPWLLIQELTYFEYWVLNLLKKWKRDIDPCFPDCGKQCPKRGHHYSLPSPELLRNKLSPQMVRSSLPDYHPFVKVFSGDDATPHSINKYF